MGRDRYKFAQSNAPHFMTCTVFHSIPVFTRPDTVNILLESFKYLIGDGMKVYAYVMLENHMHLVAQSERIDRDIARFKSFTARKLVQYLTANNVSMILEQLAFYKKARKGDRSYQFRQEGVHPECIISGEMMRRKVDYIHYNPVVRGYVDRPEHWRYSSARSYLGLEGLLEVCREW
jgi:putative transposase